MNEQQEIILDHYHNPRNFGLPDWNADRMAKLQNLSCGDEIEVFVKQVGEIINDIRFVGEGCSIAIASASILFDKVKGKTLAEIKKITSDDVIQFLGITLTPSRLKCATLSLETLKKALAD